MPIYAYADLLFEQRIQADQQARLQNYKTWYEYYNGDHALPLKIKEGQENDNVIINLDCRQGRIVPFWQRSALRA